MAFTTKAITCATIAYMAALTIACTVSDGTNTFDLSKIRITNSIPIVQDVPSNPSLDGTFDWTISMCSLIGPGFGKTCGSTQSAYAFQFNPSGSSCTQAMNIAKSDWSWSAGSAIRSFIGGQGETALSITCDPTVTGPLVVDGPAITENVNGVWVWNIKFKSAAVCPGVRPAPGISPGPDPGPGPGSGPDPGPISSYVLGGGFWFLLAFLITSVFCVAGIVLFYFIRLGKRGKELAPYP